MKQTDTARDDWPSLDERALHGPAGALVRKIAPVTDADPAAVLVQLLVALGAAMGRGPHTVVGPTRHGVGLYALVVGSSARARKGSAWHWARRIILAVELARSSCLRIASGLSSGEGIIHALRDPSEQGKTKTGEPIVDEGVTDKRLLVVESELASVLKAIERQGNSLSPVLRCAWDGVPLETLTRAAPMRATDPHLAICAHVTVEELLARLTATETANGFLNRFLVVLARRSRIIARPGPGLSDTDLQADIARLARAVDLAAKRGDRLDFDDAGGRRWDAAYPSLVEDHPGILGHATSRSDAQALRLALLFALLDCEDHIGEQHVEASLALWGYCHASARYLFSSGRSSSPEDTLRAALRSAGERGLTRTEIRDLFGRHRPVAEIEVALASLVAAGAARRASDPSTGGRPAERFAWCETCDGSDKTIKAPPFGRSVASVAQSRVPAPSPDQDAVGALWSAFIARDGAA